MEINLETDERIKLIIDKTCEFEVWGERNDEGTMVIKNETQLTNHTLRRKQG